MTTRRRNGRPAATPKPAIFSMSPAAKPRYRADLTAIDNTLAALDVRSR